MCNLLVTALVIALLLIESGNVELNPGSMTECPKYEKMVSTSFIVNLLCYVAMRVLHFSAFVKECFSIICSQ